MEPGSAVDEVALSTLILEVSLSCGRKEVSGGPSFFMSPRRKGGRRVSKQGELETSRLLNEGQGRRGLSLICISRGGLRLNNKGQG